MSEGNKCTETTSTGKLNSSQRLNRKTSSPMFVIKIQCSDSILVFVDSKYPYSMKLRQLWQEDTKEGAGIDDEMCGIIFCVETS